MSITQFHSVCIILIIFLVREERNYITCLLCKDLVQLVDDAILSNNTISQVKKSQWLLERITQELFFASDRRNFGWDLLYCWKPPRSLWRLYQLKLGKCDWFIGQWISESRRNLYSIVSVSLKIKAKIVNLTFSNFFLSFLTGTNIFP